MLSQLENGCQNLKDCQIKTENQTENSQNCNLKTGTFEPKYLQIRGGRCFQKKWELKYCRNIWLRQQEAGRQSADMLIPLRIKRN